MDSRLGLRAAPDRRRGWRSSGETPASRSDARFKQSPCRRPGDLPPYVHACDGMRPPSSPSLAAGRWSLVVGLPQAGSRAAAPTKRQRATVGQAQRDAAPAPRRRSRRCTARPAQLLPGGPTAFARAAGERCKRPPGRRQQLGLVVRSLPQRVPALPAASACSTASRSRSSASTRATTTGDAQRFLEQSDPCPTRPTLDHDEDDRAVDRARPRACPITVFFDAEGKRRLRPPGRVPRARPTLAADMQRYAVGA